MSDTPRTDRQEKQYGLGLPFSSIVGSAFARQLERELAEARKEREQWKAQYWAMCDRYDALDLKLDAAMASDPPAAEKG